MISIILPAYNAEKYLNESISSVLEQDYSDYELILVDDGSTDSTGRIIDDFSAQSKKIIPIHKTNGGLSDARNAGLDIAQGEYVFFIDADDVVSPNTLTTLLRAIKDTGADAALAPFRKFKGNPPLKWNNSEIKTVVTGRDAVEGALYQTLIDHGAWGKLYKMSLWKDVRFRKGILYEDLDVFYRVWLKAAKIAILDSPLYGYRQHSESILHTFNHRRIDVLDVTDRLVRWIKGNQPSLLRAAYDRRMSAHFNILLLMWKNGMNNPEIEQKCLNVIEMSAKNSYVNSKVRLKNRFGALAYLLGGEKLLRILARFM